MRMGLACIGTCPPKARSLIGSAWQYGGMAALGLLKRRRNHEQTHSIDGFHLPGCFVGMGADPARHAWISTGWRRHHRGRYCGLLVDHPAGDYRCGSHLVLLTKPQPQSALGTPIPQERQSGTRTWSKTMISRRVDAHDRLRERARPRAGFFLAYAGFTAYALP
jgi:hypothetical protein